MSRRVFRRAVALLAVAVVVTSFSVSPTGAAENSGSGLESGVVVAQLEVGKDIHYSGGGEDLLRWGPVGVVSDELGSFWVGDGAKPALVHVVDGAVVSRIELNSSSLYDFDVSDGLAVVLDAAAQPALVRLIDLNTGRQTKRISIPVEAGLEQGLSGVTFGERHEIVLEYEGGTALRTLGQDSVLAAPTRVLSTAAGSIALQDAGSELSNQRTVLIDKVALNLESENLLGTVQVVEATPGATYLQVEEVSQTLDGVIKVDQTVRIVDAGGNTDLAARVPLDEMVTAVPSPTTVDREGDVFALVPLADVVEIRLLTTSAKLVDVLPPLSDARQHLTEEMQTQAAGCVSRSTMGAIDGGYRSLNTYYSATNISGACTGRTKPSYLSSAGAYTSVAYKWGGFNTVSSYDAAMSPGTGRAGDTTSGSTLSCAYGVDCSGFVSRVWQRTTKYSTTTLPNITFAVSVGSMLEYDIFNLAGSHTRMFRWVSGGGYYVSEATTGSSLDRVVFRWLATSAFNGYSTRRFNSVC